MNQEQASSKANIDYATVPKQSIGRQTKMILLLSAVAFLGSFVGSLNARSGEADDGAKVGKRDCDRRPPLGGCLQMDPERRERIDALDPMFFDDLGAMREERTAHRHALAELLQSPDSTDDEIRAAVEDSIELQNQIERRVLEHLLLIRSELTLEEQQRLFGSISDRIRGHGGRFGRHRGADGKNWRGDGAGKPWRKRSRMNEEHMDDDQDVAEGLDEEEGV